ncbi:MAG: helix-turn-helix transcriptional regulator [Rhodobacteraceae bacterium]|nr:helix-turn-helix transcriptional regulator [Paracoccaceae bacterium]
MRTDWLPQTAEIIESLSDARFPSVLASALRDVVPFEFCVIFGYPAEAPPLTLHEDFPADRRRMHVADYQAGPYILDPFYVAGHNPEIRGLYRLSDIAPDRFYHGEYFRNYYAKTGLAEEIGYLVTVREDLALVISLMRTEKRFSAVEVRHLAALWPVVEAASRQHWKNLQHPEDDQQGGISDRIRTAFHSIGQGVLTSREQEIVEHTLKGYSADATGKALGISPGTVRIHRRNVYAKLRISSQGELFSEFISVIMAEKI